MLTSRQMLARLGRLLQQIGYCRRYSLVTVQLLYLESYTAFELLANLRFRRGFDWSCDVSSVTLKLKRSTAALYVHLFFPGPCPIPPGRYLCVNLLSNKQTDTGGDSQLIQAVLCPALSFGVNKPFTLKHTLTQIKIFVKHKLQSAFLAKCTIQF